jgi:hypothetical protein
MILLLCQKHQRLLVGELSRRRSASMGGEGMQEVKRY